MSSPAYKSLDAAAERDEEELLATTPAPPTSPPPIAVDFGAPVFEDFSPPPVIHGIEEETIAERLSSSLADLSTRVSSAVRESSTTVSRAIKGAVPLSSASKSPYKVVVAFGDSITERGNAVSHPLYGIGWTAVLAELLRSRADILTRGFSGYNTRYAVAALPKVMSGPAVCADVVLVWFGANDAVKYGRGGQHVSVEDYGLNLSKLVHDIRSMRPASPIVPVLITPPPLHDEAYEGANKVATSGSGPRTNANTSLYARECAEVARRMGCPSIDIYNGLSKHAGSQANMKKFFCDGLHLSGEGNKFVGRYMYNELKAQVPGFSDEELPRWFPEWGTLGKLQNPAGAFL
jgi:isoamyl acetate esterase